MRKIAGALVLSLLSPLSIAGECQPRVALDKVVFQVSARQWVTTQTALLTVNVNATLNNADLVKARADIMDKLSKIASGEWHLTQFDRSQDSSGLEKLFVEAQTRVPQASLTDIYQHAKDVSKPGATYTIDGVEFKPSIEEVQQIKNQVREQLYKQVNDELARLNKVYTNQNYTVNRLYITDNETPVQPKPMAMKTMVMSAGASTPSTLTVSNELTLNAVVEAASNRQGGNAVGNN